MPYAHATWLDLKNELASRLGDSGMVYWDGAELEVYLAEAMRLWQLLTNAWKERGVLQTAANTTFYDLPTKLPSLFTYTVKDTDLVKEIQWALLEPATGVSWTGTDQFNLTGVTAAVRRRRDQFLVETGSVLTRTLENAAAPPIGRIDLPDDVIDVRRLAWLSSGGTYTTLWRENEHRINSYIPGWAAAPTDPPAVYSVAVTPPVQLQLAPAPMNPGQLDLVTTRAGAALDPANGVLLGIPDDAAWIVRWGALADLLGGDGQSRDPERARYCEMRYRQGVDLMRGRASILRAEVNGLPVPLASLVDFDAYSPGWQNATPAQPGVVAMAGFNLIAVTPPDGVYGVTLDTVRKAPIPAAPGAAVQLGREEIDAILNYALHVACFKMAGDEFTGTAHHLEALVRAAGVRNERLRTSGVFPDIFNDQAVREARLRPRRSRYKPEMEAYA